MTWYTRIKNFYDQDRWTISMVADGVTAGKITPEEFETITNVNYQHYLDNLSA